MYRMILSCCAVALFVSALPASAGWTKIEGFDTYGLGGLGGQGGWQTEPGGPYSVADDPTNTANQVLSVATDSTGGHYARNNTYAALNLPDGATGTLYVRVRREVGGAHIGFGLSDVAAPTAWGDYEVAIRSQGGNFDVRDDDTYDPLATNTPIQEWYEFWLVANNAAGTTADTTKVYVQSPVTFPTQTQLGYGGQTDFAFRNGTSAALQTMFLNTGSGHTGPWLLDDVHFDAAGANLTSPTSIIPSFHTVFANDFETDAAGFTPVDGNGGSSSDGTWDVAGGIYSQTNSGLASNGQTLGAYSLADPVVPGFRLNVDVRLDDPNGAGDAAIVFGWQDNDNYYFVIFNEDTGNNEMFVVEGGTRSLLADNYASGFQVDQFYHVELERDLALGLITMSVDGVEVILLGLASAALAGYVRRRRAAGRVRRS